MQEMTAAVASARLRVPVLRKIRERVRKQTNLSMYCLMRAEMLSQSKQLMRLYCGCSPTPVINPSLSRSRHGDISGVECISASAYFSWSSQTFLLQLMLFSSPLLVVSYCSGQGPGDSIAFRRVGVASNSLMREVQWKVVKKKKERSGT